MNKSKITPISEILQEALCGYDKDGKSSKKYIHEKSFIKWGKVEADINAVFDQVIKEKENLAKLLKKYQYVENFDDEDDKSEFCISCGSRAEEGCTEDCEIKKALNE